jgi:type II secretory pathway pseudopilin PulG
MSSPRRGWTLVEALVVAIVLLVAAALVIPAVGQVSRREKVVRCIGALQALHRAQAAAGPAEGKLGMDYWRRLASGPNAALAPSALRCPLGERLDGPDCHYMGPRSDPAPLNPLQPIGCDLETNHSPNMRQGGNVLLKSGEVSTEKGDGGLWLDARTKYCRP